MKVLSLFSGVGGFDLGLENAGMETVFQCEWDKHATNILERHWPHVPRWGDVSTLTGQHILAHAPVIDVVAWGSPCQDLSVAGKRAGLQGARSGLFHEGVRIIKELRELTDGKYPRISIWENVAGALSSGGGADFGQVLYEMDEAGACFSEWRILDAQYFGVPQRRRRVFLVSVFDPATAARCPDPLLPVCEGVQWHPQTGNTTGEAVAGEVAGCLRSGGAGGVPSSRGEHLVVEPFTKSRRPQSATDDETWVANQPNPTLNAFDQGDTRATTVVVEEPTFFQMHQSGETRIQQGVMHTLAGYMGTGGNNTPMVAQPIEDPVLLTMREGKPGGGKGPLVSTDKSLSLRTGNEQTLFTPIGFSHTQGLSAQPSQAAWPTLRTENNGMAVAIPIQDGRDMEKHQNGLGVAEEGAPSYTLDQTGAQAVAYVAAGFKPGASADARTIGYEEGLSPSLEAGGGGNNKPAVMTPTMAVRRLTPLECERLMGWPDDWTTGQSDTHRYKQCGNGVASPVAQWIAQQLLQLDQ